MKPTMMLAFLALAVAGTGCATKKNEARKAEASRRAEHVKEDVKDTAENVGDHATNRAEEIRDEIPADVDSMDAVMRYEVSRVDFKTSEIVLVPVELTEREIEPQSGQELRLTFEEFRTLVGNDDPSTGDMVQSLEEGGEVIVHGKRLGLANSADDVWKIELPPNE